MMGDSGSKGMLPPVVIVPPPLHMDPLTSCRGLPPVGASGRFHDSLIGRSARRHRMLKLGPSYSPDMIWATVSCLQACYPAWKSGSDSILMKFGVPLEWIFHRDQHDAIGFSTLNVRRCRHDHQ